MNDSTYSTDKSKSKTQEQRDKDRDLRENARLEKQAARETVRLAIVAAKKQERHDRILEKAAEKEKKDAEKKAKAEDKARKEAEDKQNRLKKVDELRLVLREMNRDEAALNLVTDRIWPAIWLDDEKEQNFIEIHEATNTCSKVALSYIRSGMARYIYDLSLLNDDFAWNDKQIRSCLDYWLFHTKAIENPKAWSFKSGKDLTFNRHDFDPDSSLKTPVLDEFLSRSNDPDTILSWAGGLFEAGSSRQQYLYLQGAGGDGKGAFARFLNKVLCSEYFGAQEPPSNQFFGTMFDKRKLVCFTDLRDPKFLQSPVLLGITGGDPLQLEKKGIDVVNAAVKCRVLIMSNLSPEIKLCNHDLRRILWSRIAPLSSDVKLLNDDEYDAMFWAEAPGIIGKCMEAYKRRCPQNEPLKQSQEILDEIKNFGSSRADDIFEDFADFHFEFYPPVDGKKMASSRPTISAATVSHLVSNKWLSLRDQIAFSKWLENEKGCARGPSRPRTGTFWYGIGLKSPC